MAVPRLRYTHKILIQNNTNSIYTGLVSASMVPSSVQPALPFKVEIIPSGTATITGIKITGLLNGITIIENITCDGENSIYSENTFDSISAITSRSFYSGCTIVINAVDDAYQPIYWTTTYGPFSCTFSTVEGMSAGIQPEPIGLRTVLNHYVRLPYAAPVYKNMQFTISPGYIGKTFVAITDFDIICIPPKFIPVEWAFRATEKEEI